VICLVQIVLSLEKEYNKKLRDIAQKEFGGERGSLSMAVEKGIDLLEKQINMKKAREKLLLLSKENKKLGLGKFNRDEIYEDIN
jgi:hypothetical protein